jgi:YD repeat-containing protein
VTLPNGMVATPTFDDANQLRTISYDLGATHIGDLAYSYDLAGRRIEQSGSFAALSIPSPVASFGRRTTRTVSGTTTQYLYDGMNPATVSGNQFLAGLGLDEFYAVGERRQAESLAFNM